MSESPRRKICIAVPIYSGACGEFIASLLNLATHPPVDLDFRIMTSQSLISRARNELAAEFLKTDSTHLMFIDSDLAFTADHVKRLLDRDKDIVGGLYAKKMQGKLQWCYNDLPGVSPILNESKLHPVRYIGTGFMLIKRAVIERMVADFGPLIEYMADPPLNEKQWDLFPVGVYPYNDGKSRYLSEDWYFCQRWLDMGGEIWADGFVTLKHIGPVAFPLDTQLADMQLPDVKEDGA